MKRKIFVAIALFAVSTMPAFGYLTRKPINFSCRAEVHAGDKVMILGFVVDAAYAQQMLVRAIGPTLADFQVKNPNPHVTLAVYQMIDGGSVKIAEVDGWDPQLSSVFKRVGAFGLTQGRGDSAVLLTLSSGLYTAVVHSPVDGGIGMAEVYQMDPDTNPGGLVNASIRGVVATGEGQLIPGMTVKGSGKCKMMVRAVGPSLEQFGVADTLQDPMTELNMHVAVDTYIAVKRCVNDYASFVFDQFGAFRLPFLSKDAVMVYPDDLSGWNIRYTAPIWSASGTEGKACLAEAYFIEIP